MNKNFEHGINKLYGTFTFNMSTSSASSTISIYGTGTSAGCSIVSIPQDKGRKPHIAVITHDQRTLMEIGARQTSIYNFLSQYVGSDLERFSWEERQSMYEEGSYLKCDASLAYTKPTTQQPAIPRIILDTETTGLNPLNDEILQLSIIDNTGNVLIDQLYHPSRNQAWPDAQRIHCISPNKVASMPSIDRDLDAIQSILDRAQQVCAYNAEYDLAFLGELGLHLDKTKVLDTMRLYGNKFHGTPFYKLEKAAAECGFKYQAHNSLEDCRATLVVQAKAEGAPLNRKQIKNLRKETSTQWQHGKYENWFKAQKHQFLHDEILNANPTADLTYSAIGQETVPTPAEDPAIPPITPPSKPNVRHPEALDATMVGGRAGMPPTIVHAKDRRRKHREAHKGIIPFHVRKALNYVLFAFLAVYTLAAFSVLFSNNESPLWAGIIVMLASAALTALEGKHIHKRYWGKKQQ